MTTTRNAISEAVTEFVERHIISSDALDRDTSALIDRLLSITSGGGEVSDEEIQDEANRRYPHNNSDALEDKIKNLSQRSAFCNGARWLRSKGKVRVPLFKLVDPIRIEQVVPLRVEVGDQIHTVQPVIEGNTIVWRWPTHAAQDGGLPTKKCGCPNDLCCDECYQINQP